MKTYKTRQNSNNNVPLPKPNQNQLKRKLFYNKGAHAWNNIYPDTHNMETLINFRTDLMLGTSAYAPVIYDFLLNEQIIDDIF